MGTCKVLKHAVEVELCELHAVEATADGWTLTSPDGAWETLKAEAEATWDAEA